MSNVQVCFLCDGWFPNCRCPKAEPVDLTKLARKLRRQEHKHVHVRQVDGIEVCSCGDRFPCTRTCAHLDCIDRACELGLKRDIPDNVLGRTSILNEGHAEVASACSACDDDPGEHFKLWIDSSVPRRMWVLPSGWKVVTLS